MSEHTRGPWTMEASGGYWIIRTDDQRISTLIEPLNPKRVEANARLIAAAPTMFEENAHLRAINAVLLDAVREAQEFLAGVVFDKEMEGDEGMPLRKQLADAIAKAEGQS